MVVVAPPLQKMEGKHSQSALTDRRSLERAFRAFLPLYMAAQVQNERRRRHQVQGRAPTPTRNASAPTSEHVWIPRMDVCDDPSSPHIVATLELPGMKKDDLHLEMRSGCLVISGQRLALNARQPGNALGLTGADSEPAPSPAPQVRVTPASPTEQSSAEDMDTADDTACSDHVAHPDNPTPEPEPAPRVASPIYPIQELKYGRFERAIKLPPGIETQPSVITASMADGMLTVTWPRAIHTHTTQRIEIQ